MKVAVVGLGLIGGSFEKASLKAGHEVVSCHHGDKSGFEDSDLVLVCLPPESIVPWIRERQDLFRAGTVVVDICGIKRKICQEVNPIALASRAGGTVNSRDPGGTSDSSGSNGARVPWYFVGGHPMAGREVSGYANSKEDLFVGASMIITPDESVPQSVIEMLKGYFASVGFHRTVITTPEKHDEMIAFTSQLCHVIATAYARDPKVVEAIGYSAGSYANMTRVATQNADTWASLYLEDREALLRTLDSFIGRLGEFREALAAADLPRMKAIIDEGTAAKSEELLARERGDER